MDTEHCMLMDLLFDDMSEEDEEDEAESQEESADTKEN